jgi:type I restriction enzyme S subunit
MTLGDVVTEIRNGIDLEQFDCPTRTATWPISRIETISEARIDLDRVKYVSPTPEQVQRYQLRAGDILFSHINSPEHIGKTALFTGQNPLIHGINLLLLRADTARCCPAYLDALLKSSGVRLHFRMRCKKAVNQASLNQDDILSLQIRLPSLKDQQMIAGQLEQADRLRRTRRYALELTDAFLPAAFLELFGDPVGNPRGWERARVSELGDVETGNTPPRETADYYGSEIEWIKSDNISLAQMHPSNATEGLSEKGIEVGRIVETGSLLLTCIAGSETSIGNVVLTDRRVAFNQQINAVTPHRDVNPQFLYGLFLAAKPMIQRNTTLAMKRMITKGKLEKLLLIKPPLPLQQKFAALVHRAERLRAVQREALRQAQHLFASLLHRAFND